MKIAFVAHDKPGYRGGPIVNARRLLPALHDRGHKVFALILFYGVESPSAAFLKSHGVVVEAIPFHRWTEDRINWLLDCLVSIDPDVFVPNLSVAGWFAARWAREAGIPTVAAYRSDDAFHASMVETFVLGRPEWAVSGLVCVSQTACDRVSARKPQRTELRTIPSGVPIPTRVADQNGGDEFKVVYVGRLVQENKHVLDLIEGLPGLIEILPQVTLTLIGHGQVRSDETAVDSRIEELGLSGRVERLGTVEPHRLHELLVEFQVVVLLSDYEGTPGSVMDGMACGLVPVCLDIPGGVRELVRHEETGLLVADRGKSFHAAIQRLAEDATLRKRLARNARDHVRQGYSLSVATDRWESFLESLVAGTARRSQIKKPRVYDLPSVSKGLAREDRRRPGVVMRALHQTGKRLVTWWRDKKGFVDPSASFLQPKPGVFSMDRFLVRRSVLDAVVSHRNSFKGVLLDIGCGQMPYKQVLMEQGSSVETYLGLDFEVNPIHDNQPDIFWEDGRIPLDTASVDSALCTEVLEHCPDPDVVLAEVVRVLKPGGSLLFTVPFIWPLHEVPYDHYRFTPFALRRHLTRAGFGTVELRATGGWDASLAQMLGLWVRRRPMSGLKRALLSVLAYPLYRWLVHIDKPIAVKFTESQMLTGLWGVATKPVSQAD